MADIWRTEIHCDRCGKDVWNEEHEVNQFRSSIIEGYDYYYLCYDCHDEIATPLEWFIRKLRKLPTMHCKEAQDIVQKYRAENGGCIHTSLMRVMAEKGRYYPKYL